MTSSPPPPSCSDSGSGSGPTLTDGVVTLRPPSLADALGAYEQCQDPLSQRWTTVPVPYSMADAESYVGTVLPGRWADDSEWSFTLLHEGRFGGTVSLRNEGSGRAEIAYGSHPDVRGTGAVERGLRLLLDWGFAEKRLHTVVWWANRGNWASRKVAWRLGFTIDGTVRGWLDHRGELVDGWVGTLLRDEPREPRVPWLDNPVVEGEGVRLRPFRDDDVPAVAEGLGDPLTQHWLAFLPRDPGAEQARDYLEQVTERLASAQTLTWAVAGADDALLGVVGLYRLVPGREAELGYWTHPSGRGRGVTSAACALAVDHAFHDLGLGRLTANVATPNTPSRRVLERLGFTEVGVQRRAARTGDGAAVDLLAYDLLAEEWPSRR